MLKGFVDSKDESDGGSWLLAGVGWAFIAKVLSNSTMLKAQSLNNLDCVRLKKIMTDYSLGINRFYFSLLRLPKKATKIQWGNLIARPKGE